MAAKKDNLVKVCLNCGSDDLTAAATDGVGTFTLCRNCLSHDKFVELVPEGVSELRANIAKAKFWDSKRGK